MKRLIFYEFLADAEKGLTEEDMPALSMFLKMRQDPVTFLIFCTAD